MNISQAYKHTQFLTARLEIYLELVKILEDRIRTRTGAQAQSFIEALRAAFPFTDVKNPIRRLGITTTLDGLDAYFEPHTEFWAPYECRKAYDVYMGKCNELMELLGIENF